jgi:hypothetical protein
MIFQKNTNSVIKKYVYLVFLMNIIVLVGSCNKGVEITFDPEIRSSVTDRYASTLKWIRSDSITDGYAYSGEALIVRRIFTIDSMLIRKEEISNIVVFEDGNIVKLKIYPFPGGFLEYSINKSLYNLKIRYWDPLKNYGEEGIRVKFDKSQLVFKNDSFQRGDTVLGYLKLCTNPYLRNKQTQYDTYEGYFTSIIFPKDSVTKYTTHYITMAN